MAVLKYKDGKSWRIIADILKAFAIKTKGGKDFVQYYKGSKIIEQGKHKGDALVFFHAPKEHKNGGWTTVSKNDEWLNIPWKDWDAFNQVMLTENISDFVDNFKAKQIAKKELAVFMKERDGYHFYGIYKSLLVNGKTSLCLYYRISKTLDTNDWS